MSEIPDIFSPEQKSILEAVKGKGNIFITGGAGSGKSWILEKVIDQLREKGRNLIVCAPTGTAAVKIGGTTIHRAFGFSGSVCINEATLTIKTNASTILQKADAVIIDEISMCRMDLFDAVASSIRKAENKRGKPIQVILAGDFYQLPPVLSYNNSDRELIEKYYNRKVGRAYAFQADHWNSFDFQVFELKEIYRQCDEVFIRKLNQLRIGRLREPDYFNLLAAKEIIPDAPFLFPYNKQAEALNLSRLSKLPGELKEFTAILEGDAKETDLNGAPILLRLKNEARVMLTVNESEIDISNPNLRAYHNGSVGTVKGFSCRNGNPEILIKLDNGRNIRISRKQFMIYTYILNEDGHIDRKAIGSIMQFPLRLAYAVTIHKSQGMTYEKVNIDPNCRNPGQLYVALSRGREIGGIHLMTSIQPTYICTDPVVDEFYEKYVYKPPEKRKDTSIAPSRGGRPRRFPNGSMVIRLPIELVDPIARVIDRIYPIFSTKTIDEERLNRFLMYLDELLR